MQKAYYMRYILCFEEGRQMESGDRDKPVRNTIARKRDRNEEIYLRGGHIRTLVLHGPC
jgi:hypothetical protein